MVARLSLSPRFPAPARMTGQDLTQMGQLVKGLGVVQLGQLRRQAIMVALTSLREIDFDEAQAEEILEELLDGDAVTRVFLLL
ncbi:hypothetical protein ElyMa_004857100 [Elysia marginata]|uniref:Flagellar motor switch protein FliG n=1 Tax=Elysia marginata TaxID=1093978 RepID=A0AAV4IUE3_9GAST|nr:hypothetical protein ElyMa_004857100 [Elysia marginata]